MKIIPTNGIYNFQEIPGSTCWYWCCDYASGDLYEAQELFESRHPVNSNRLLLIRYPEGEVVEPIRGEAGQYFGSPAWEDGKVYILMVDFPRKTISLFQYDHDLGKTTLTAEIPLGAVKDCYNLMLAQSPLMMIRQGAENDFQVVWPEKADFALENTESFTCREGELLYFSRWYEDPDYREEVVVRHFPNGEIRELIPGVLMEMPDGQKWILG